MSSLAELMPEFFAEVYQLLETEGRGDLASQLRECSITRVTYDRAADAAYIYLRSAKTLNIVENNIIGVKHGETISLQHPWMVNLDTDNFGRLVGIEVLSGKRVAVPLKQYVAT